MKTITLTLLILISTIGTCFAQQIPAQKIIADPASIAKEKAEQGFKDCNNALTLDVLFGMYSVSLDEDDACIAIYGEAEGLSNEKIGTAKSTKAALDSYAAEITNSICDDLNSKGKLKDTEECDKFRETLTQRLQTKLFPQIKRHFTIRKNIKGDTWLYESYLSVSKANAKKTIDDAVIYALSVQ